MTSISEKDFYQLTLSVNKALNGVEAPLKTKHARMAIITTHRTKEAKSFWMVVSRQPLMEQRFTAWKFCHLLHKVLREGHESAFKHSQSHKKMITEMGKLWGHLQDGVGNCIQAYTKLLVTKLEFHEKNRQFPGPLIVDFAVIERYAGQDVNVYFQLCVEIFDYLDDIINLQSCVFASINTYRMSSMTPQGQCRLSPLITLIQDSNPLYDMSVRLMFKLHDELPSDILMGHRDRFRDIFTKLKFFYDNVRPLQYFADLIQVPHLPESAPNFSSKVDFGSYIPPTVYVQPEPEPEPEPVVQNIIDTSCADSPTPALADEITALENCIRDKDFTIHELQNELTIMKRSFETMEDSYQKNLMHLQEENAVMNNELTAMKEVCTNIRLEKDDLELKLSSTPTLIQKANEEEEKAKASVEKFTKLKTMYTQIRDEHINLLRQHSDSSKVLNKERKDNVELKTEISNLQKKIEEFQQNEQQWSVKNTDLESKFEELENKHLELLASQNELNEKHKTLESTKDIQIGTIVAEKLQLKEKVAELEPLVTKLNEMETKIKLNEKSLEEAIAEHQHELKIKEMTFVDLEDQHKNEIKSFEQKFNAIVEKESELSIKHAQLTTKYHELQNKHTEAISNHNILHERHRDLESSKHVEINALTTEKMQLNKKVLELTPLIAKVADMASQLDVAENSLKDTLAKHQQELERREIAFTELEYSHTTNVALKSQNIDELQQKLAVVEADLKDKENNIENLTNQKLSLHDEIEKINQQCTLIERNLHVAAVEINTLKVENEKLNIKFKHVPRALIECIMRTLETISATTVSESSQTPLELVPKIIGDVENYMTAMQSDYETVRADEDPSHENVVRNAIMLGHTFTTLYNQCDLICKSTTEIEKGQDIFAKIGTMHSPLVQVFELIRKSGSTKEVEARIGAIRKILADLKQFIKELMNTFQQTVDVGELVQNELKEMDAAIEEAANRIAEMLSNAKQKDNGIKLEVNEKILDACTTLMECIKHLIRNSRLLQEEIISTGRGNASAREFYKRNSQWSEGLISASKSVAKGANLLVDAANKAITTESATNFELVVAAQEIAACTAQLVIASKVKAPKGSSKLTDLTKASRSVSQATGAVVATVKDCNHQMEQMQDMDWGKLTPSQIKTMEMEIHVKVLELDQALQSERFKLSAFRRKHYQMTED